jgi:hypothetical protein
MATLARRAGPVINHRHTHVDLGSSGERRQGIGFTSSHTGKIITEMTRRFVSKYDREAI